MKKSTRKFANTKSSILFGFSLVIVLCFPLLSCSTNCVYAPVIDAWHDPHAMKSRYRVQQDDTIYSIAWAFDLDYRDLARANHLLAPYRLYPGQTLTMQVDHSFEEQVPSEVATNVETYAVADGGVAYEEITKGNDKPLALSRPSSSRKAVSKPIKPIMKVAHQEEILLPEIELRPVHYANAHPPVTHKALEVIKDSSPQVITHKTVLVNEDRIIPHAYTKRWQWPARGRVVKGFSLQPGGSKGIDIAGELGDAVRAVAPGKVVYSGSGLRGYGNLVIIKHSDNYLSAYAYNKKLLVREGDMVRAGNEIAKMGHTNSGEVLLHFEIRRNGKPVNPLLYI